MNESEKEEERAKAKFLLKKGKERKRAERK